jgi:hypothetical protein
VKFHSGVVSLVLLGLLCGWAVQAEAQFKRRTKPAAQPTPAADAPAKPATPAKSAKPAAPTKPAAEQTASAAEVEELSGFGIHGGLGTDVSLGLAYGFGVSYAILPGTGGTVFEIGPDLFISNTTYEGTSGNYRYTENTSLTVFGVRANSLFNYHPRRPGVFWIVGTGIAAVAVEWTYDETNITYPDITSHDSAEGTTASWIVNLGFGATFAGPFEVRLEMPILFMFGTYGTASAIAPTLTLMAGLRF